ncbi:MAG: DsbA family protein [Sulfuricaulis sp.]|nr:DsbA family protein [Sulfuricaulis sp.]
MSCTTRMVILVLVCMSLMACAGPTPAPDSVPGDDSGRSSRSSGIAYRDRPIQAIEKSLPQVSVKDDPRLGSATARIGIVEVNDYQCPYCRDFHHKQFAQIKQEYVDTGVVRFIHKDFPLRMHAQAVPAAVAARCAAAQGRFWEMHDALFTQQGRLGQNLYLGVARGLNLDEKKFSACLENRAHVREIGKDIDTARSLGINGTPSFLIGTIEGDTLTVVRMSRGAPGYEVFVQEIEKLRQPAAVPPQ